VEAILSRMDQAAPGFQAMSANIRLTTYVAVITDTTVEDGTLVMQRLKNGSVRAVLDFSHQKDASAKPDSSISRKYRTDALSQAKTYQDYDVAKKRRLKQFLFARLGRPAKN